MTRRGSLAYYLAAWVIGGFVVALGFWWASSTDSSVSGFLMAYFFALIAGPVDLVLFAFLLRRALRWSGTHNLFVWAMTGAALFFGLLALLTTISMNLGGALQAGGPYLLESVLFSGPDALLAGGFWPAPLEGAGVAIVLCLVDRAFDRPAEPSQPPQLGPAHAVEANAVHAQSSLMLSLPQPPAHPSAEHSSLEAAAEAPALLAELPPASERVLPELSSEPAEPAPPSEKKPAEPEAEYKAEPSDATPPPENHG